MGRKALFYGTTMIVIYLLVANASGSGRLITAGASGVATDVKAFQGRG